MNYLWPGHLWLLLLLPVLPPLYLWLLRRRPGLRFSSLGVVRAAALPGWRRHVPAVLLWVACGLLLFAAARPTMRLALPGARSTILLAIDVSLSMRVDDVKPTRMAAAQDAARTFLGELPRDVDVGLVTFAGSAQVAQAATPDRDAVRAAIDGLQMQYGTAIGNAIVLCLAELFPEHGIDLTSMTYDLRRGYGGHDARPKVTGKPFTPVKPGSYASAAIVLLSDGRRTTGVDTLEAAKMAADRGVRVYVVGLGTVDGAASSGDGFAIYLKLDEPTLQEVARMTGGEYHYAGTAEQLRGVYRNLGSRLQVEARETEIAPLLSLAAALLVAITVGLALRAGSAGRATSGR